VFKRFIVFKKFINFYLRYQNINLKISFILISLQLLHLYWLTTDVVIYRLTGIDYFVGLSDFILLFIIIDYIEIPALVSGIIYYFFALIYDKKEKEKTFSHRNRGVQGASQRPQETGAR